jgi:hypothetical protein
MQCEDNPNIIYGGDPDDTLEEQRIDYKTLGQMILRDLALGGDRPSFVSCFYH